MKESNISHVDIIWMDLQGAELLALQSLGDYLKKVEYIFTEVSHKEMYTGQVMFPELHTFLLQNGFINITPISQNGWQEDVIYKKV
jgi:hypothetical protein